MKEERNKTTNVRVSYNNVAKETKYYLLTQSSGYPLADFNFPNQAAQEGARLVIPENRD